MRAFPRQEKPVLMRNNDDPGFTSTYECVWLSEEQRWYDHETMKNGNNKQELLPTDVWSKRTNHVNNELPGVKCDTMPVYAAVSDQKFGTPQSIDRNTLTTSYKIIDNSVHFPQINKNVVKSEYLKNTCYPNNSEELSFDRGSSLKFQHMDMEHRGSSLKIQYKDLEVNSDMVHGTNYQNVCWDIESPRNSELEFRLSGMKDDSLPIAKPCHGLNNLPMHAERIMFTEEDVKTALEKATLQKGTSRELPGRNKAQIRTCAQDETQYAALPFPSLKVYYLNYFRHRDKDKEGRRFEGFRLKTFANIQTAVSTLRLVADGFYATGIEDETQCFSCGVTYRNWLPQDNPNVIHRRISPSCRHAMGSDTSNVPLSKSSNGRLPTMDMSDSAHEPASAQRTLPPEVSKPENKPANVNNYVLEEIRREIPENLIFVNLAYPKYRGVGERLNSFLGWPGGHCKEPRDLVKAGFFYSGVSDSVRCYVCGVGLKEWDQTDDPWHEHVRWRSTCEFVQKVKGQEFVYNTLAKLGRVEQTNSAFSVPSGASSSSANAQGPTNRPSALERALEMGFSSDEVTAEADNIRKRTGCGSIHLDDLLTSLLTVDGPDDTSPPSSSNWPSTSSGYSTSSSNIPCGGAESLPVLHSAGQAGITVADGGSVDNHNGSNSHWQTSATSNKIETDSVSTKSTSQGQIEMPSISAKLQPGDLSSDGEEKKPREHVWKKRLKDKTSNHHGASWNPANLVAAVAENQRLKEDVACKVCLEEPANIVFLPCGHLVTCAVCYPALDRCPVCRVHIRGTVRAQRR